MSKMRSEFGILQIKSQRINIKITNNQDITFFKLHKFFCISQRFQNRAFIIFIPGYFYLLLANFFKQGDKSKAHKIFFN